MEKPRVGLKLWGNSFFGLRGDSLRVVLYLFAAATTACGFALYSMQEGRIYIDVVNRSARPVEARLWERQYGFRTHPVALSAGELGGLALETQPWEYWVGFRDPKNGKFLGLVPIRRKDEIDGRFLVRYDPVTIPPIPIPLDPRDCDRW